MRLLIALLVTSVACSAPPPERVLVSFQTGDAPYNVRAEVADSDDEMRRGLMGRESLSPGTGMLFVWQEEGEHNFHMQDTLIPLDLISIRNGEVVGIQRMVPCTTEPCPFTKTPLIDAALEVAAGTAKEAGIARGTRVESEALP